MEFKKTDGSVIKLEDIKVACNQDSDTVFYFTNETKEDNLDKLTKSVDKLGRMVYVKKLHYTLEANDFLYSVHII